MNVQVKSWRNMDNYEQNAIALALANKQPWKVAELLGKIPQNSFVDEVFDAQTRNTKS